MNPRNILAGIISALAIFVFGMAIGRYMTTPINVDITEHGVQITTMDGNGFWWDLE